MVWIVNDSYKNANSNKGHNGGLFNYNLPRVYINANSDFQYGLCSEQSSCKHYIFHVRKQWVVVFRKVRNG